MTDDYEKNKTLAVEVAEALGDTDNLGYYIILAKNEDHNLIYDAKNWVSDYENPNDKGKLFSWKFNSLKAERNTNIEDANESPRINPKRKDEFEKRYEGFIDDKQWDF